MTTVKDILMGSDSDDVSDSLEVEEEVTNPVVSVVPATVRPSEPTQAAAATKPAAIDASVAPPNPTPIGARVPSTTMAVAICNTPATNAMLSPSSKVTSAATTSDVKGKMKIITKNIHAGNEQADTVAE